MLKPLFMIAMSLTAMVVGTGEVVAQNYPNKPIRFVTSEPGGGSDSASRIIAQGISGPLGQPVIVDNRGGGGGVLADIVMRAAPDGHTLLVTAGSVWVATLFRRSSYDILKDFAPIALLVASPHILVLHPSVAANSVKDLINLAKAKPGQLNYASTSIGSSGYLAAELFKAAAGVDMMHIPYKSSGAATTALMSGEVQVAFGTTTAVTAHIKSGKLKALAATSPKPSPLAPGLPTVAATLPGYDFRGTTAMFAPAKTPAAIVTRLNREVVKLLNQPEVKERFFNTGVDIVVGTPEQLTATIKSDLVRLGKVVRDLGIREE